MDLIGSKTEANLKAALWGEAKAYIEYCLFAEKALQEGYPQLAHIYEEMARIEKDHYLKVLNVLQGGLPETIDGLERSAESEEYEWKNLYRKFTMDAEEEGFDDIAEMFYNIAVDEHDHEAIFRKFLTSMPRHLPRDTED